MKIEKRRNAEVRMEVIGIQRCMGRFSHDMTLQPSTD
jgi:hypothetical protein